MYVKFIHPLTRYQKTKKKSWYVFCINFVKIKQILKKQTNCRKYVLKIAVHFGRYAHLLTKWCPLQLATSEHWSQKYMENRNGKISITPHFKFRKHGRICLLYMFSKWFTDSFFKVLLKTVDWTESFKRGYWSPSNWILTEPLKNEEEIEFMNVQWKYFIQLTEPVLQHRHWWTSQRTAKKW